MVSLGESLRAAVECCALLPPRLLLSPCPTCAGAAGWPLTACLCLPPGWLCSKPPLPASAQVEGVSTAEPPGTGQRLRAGGAQRQPGLEAAGGPAALEEPHLRAPRCAERRVRWRQALRCASPPPPSSWKPRERSEVRPGLCLPGVGRKWASRFSSSPGGQGWRGPADQSPALALEVQEPSGMWACARGGGGLPLQLCLGEGLPGPARAAVWGGQNQPRWSLLAACLLAAARAVLRGWRWQMLAVGQSGLGAERPACGLLGGFGRMEARAGGQGGF